MSFTLFLPTVTVGDAPIVEVRSLAFSTSLKDLAPVDTVSRAVTRQPDDPLYCVMTIRGTGLGLAVLERSGRLPVFHQWRLGARFTPPIDVGLKPRHWERDREVLREQVNANGFFEWRTYSSKTEWEYGTWTVIVTDVNRDLVRTIGRRPVPARLTILVQKE